MNATIEMNVNEDTFANTLKKLREERGWSRLELADKISALPTVGERVVALPIEIANWESGEAWPNSDQLERIFNVIPQLREFAQMHTSSRPVAAEEPPAIKTLNQAIREAREFEKISIADAA